MFRCVYLAALFAACVLLAFAPSPAVASEVRCRGGGQCRQPDSMNVLLRPGATDLILEGNFGLVYAAQEGWQYTCDDIFAGRVPNRSQIAQDGRVFVPAADGLSFSNDGCNWTRAAGPLVGQNVNDVSFDPVMKQRVWIVGGDPRL